MADADYDFGGFSPGSEPPRQGAKDLMATAKRQRIVNIAGGEDLNVTLLVNSDYSTDKNIAEAVVAMMSDVGVTVTLTLNEVRKVADTSAR